MSFGGVVRATVLRHQVDWSGARTCPVGTLLDFTTVRASGESVRSSGQGSTDRVLCVRAGSSVVSQCPLDLYHNVNLAEPIGRLIF